MKNGKNFWLGLALGVIIGGLLVFYIVPAEKNMIESEPATNEAAQEREMLMLSAPPPTSPGPVVLDTANAWVNSYLANPNRTLKSPATGVDSMLKGWYLDRWVIDSLFRKYNHATGLQCYIGKKPDRTHTLILAARYKSAGADSLCLGKNNSLYDFLNPCPSQCPPVNNLPK